MFVYHPRLVVEQPCLGLQGGVRLPAPPGHVQARVNQPAHRLVQNYLEVVVWLKTNFCLFFVKAYIDFQP